MGCIPKVQKFLCCLELETGGIIIGWLAAILSAIGVIAFTAGLIVITIAFNQDVNSHKDDVKAVFIGEELKSFEVRRNSNFDRFFSRILHCLLDFPRVCHFCLLCRCSTHQRNEKCKRTNEP
jgi:hypothetical protein